MTKLLSQIHTITDGNIATPKGFHADGQHVGLKHKSKDLGWIYSDVPASVAGVFTTNQVQAAPVQLDKNVIQNGQIQAIIVNSGNANAVTGAIGLTHAKTMQAVTAAQLNISPELVAVSSTGVIGQPLPIDTVTAGIAKLNIDGDADSFAEAIKTTIRSKKPSQFNQKLQGIK